MEKDNTVSISEYARHCGVSRTAIQKAIKSGRIAQGYDFFTKRIKVDIADKEYGLKTIVKSANVKMKQDVPQEWLNNLANVPVSEITLSPSDYTTEAERKMTIIKAQRELLKLKTESGELVSKEAVYRELFDKGKEIKLALQAIPDRVVDQMISMGRNDAHRLLTEEINQVLTKLSEANAD